MIYRRLTGMRLWTLAVAIGFAASLTISLPQLSAQTIARDVTTPASGVVRPIILFISTAGVFHPIEPVGIDERGVMQDPQDSVTVGWYEDFAALDEGDHVVMAGNSGTLGIRPGVFSRLGELTPGDQVEVLGSDDVLYEYEVAWVRSWKERSDVPLDEGLNEAEGDILTLMSGSGTPRDPFVVVRAVQGQIDAELE